MDRERLCDTFLARALSCIRISAQACKDVGLSYGYRDDSAQKFRNDP